MKEFDQNNLVEFFLGYSLWIIYVLGHLLFSFMWGWEGYSGFNLVNLYFYGPVIFLKPLIKSHIVYLWFFLFWSFTVAWFWTRLTIFLLKKRH